MMQQLAVATLALLATMQQAHAQATPAVVNLPTHECARDAATQAYSACALWFDGRAVRQGAEGVKLARVGMFRPLRLRQYVVGDSALKYAAAYERDLGRSTRLSIAGSALYLAGFLVLQSYQCRPDATRGYCTTTDDGHAFATVGLSLLGSGLFIASVPFALRGNRAAARAIWWHNAAFMR